MADETNQNTQNTQTPPSAQSAPVVEGVNNDRLMGILSYLGILVLIPLLATKNRSAFLTAHINQGVNLFLISLIGWAVLSFVNLYFLMNIWQLLMLILTIIGIINVAKNQTKVLPIIGNWFHLVK